MNRSARPRYVIDSSVLIEAARRYYAFDIAPTFWSKLVEYARQGVVVSIDRVKDEINRGKDKLADWCNKEFHIAFDQTRDSGVLRAYNDIMQWAQTVPQYIDAAKSELAAAENADAWVVAYAKARTCTVVSHEQFDAKIRRRVPIPNICKAFNVEHIDTFEMMRQLKIKL